MARPTRTKRGATALDFVDALAEVIASRVAAKILDAQKPPPMPEQVPMWLFGRSRRGEHVTRR